MMSGNSLFTSSASAAENDDDDDDDDDDLLTSPTFNHNKTLRTKESRQEERMLHYLDICVEEENERFDRNDRMQSRILQAKNNNNNNEASTSSSSNTSPEKNDDDSSCRRHPKNESKEYWDRVYMAAEGGGSEEKLRRRRDLDDAVDGVDLSYSQDYAEEQRATKVGFASAKDTGLSTNLGVRRVLSSFRVEAMQEDRSSLLLPELFSSEEEAVKELRCVLSSMMTKTDKVIGKYRRYSMILTALNRALDEEVVPELLYYKRLSAISRTKAIGMPGRIEVWLWGIALSGTNVSAYLSEGARRTLLDWMEQKQTRRENEEDSYGWLKVRGMVRGLEVLFGYRKESDDDSNIDDEEQQQHQKAHQNVMGLKHYLELWTSAIRNNLANWEKQPNDDDNVDSSVCHLAADCLTALLRCSLDPSFHSGMGLLEPLQHLIIALLQTIQSHLQSQQNITIWIRETSSQLFHSIRQFSSGPKESADNDDVRGWLPIARAIRNIPILDSDANIFPLCIQFKSCLAEFALRHCLLLNDDVSKFDSLLQQTQSTLRMSTQDKSIQWRSISIAILAFSQMKTNHSKFTTDGPRFYTTVELASISLDMGKALVLLHHHPKQTNDAEMYRLNLVLDSLEECCRMIKKNITSVFVQPHLRRTKELLTWLSVYYKNCKDGREEGGKVKLQKCLNGWLVENDEEKEKNEDKDGNC